MAQKRDFHRARSRMERIFEKYSQHDENDVGDDNVDISLENFVEDYCSYVEKKRIKDDADESDLDESSDSFVVIDEDDADCSQNLEEYFRTIIESSGMLCPSNKLTLTEKVHQLIKTEATEKSVDILYPKKPSLEAISLRKSNRLDGEMCLEQKSINAGVNDDSPSTTSSAMCVEIKSVIVGVNNDSLFTTLSDLGICKYSPRVCIERIRSPDVTVTVPQEIVQDPKTRASDNEESLSSTSLASANCDNESCNVVDGNETERTEISPAVSTEVAHSIAVPPNNVPDASISLSDDHHSTTCASFSANGNKMSGARDSINRRFNFVKSLRQSGSLTSLYVSPLIQVKPKYKSLNFWTPRGYKAGILKEQIENRENHVCEKRTALDEPCDK